MHVVGIPSSTAFSYLASHYFKLNHMHFSGISCYGAVNVPFKDVVAVCQQLKWFYATQLHVQLCWKQEIQSEGADDDSKHEHETQLWTIRISPYDCSFVRVKTLHARTRIAWYFQMWCVLICIQDICIFDNLQLIYDRVVWLDILWKIWSCLSCTYVTIIRVSLYVYIDYVYFNIILLYVCAQVDICEWPFT